MTILTPNAVSTMITGTCDMLLHGYLHDYYPAYPAYLDCQNTMFPESSRALERVFSEIAISRPRKTPHFMACRIKPRIKMGTNLHRTPSIQEGHQSFPSKILDTYLTRTKHNTFVEASSFCRNPLEQLRSVVCSRPFR